MDTPELHLRRDADATLLAFDFGTRRIGVAVGNTLTRAAQPLATIDATDSMRRDAAVAALIGEWRPGRLVVGLPTHADGKPHAMTARARRFAAGLERHHRLPVDLVDERWTTKDAQRQLEAEGRGGRSGRAVRDEVAARIILQAWFDEAHDTANAT